MVIVLGLIYISMYIFNVYFNIMYFRNVVFKIDNFIYYEFDSNIHLC